MQTFYIYIGLLGICAFVTQTASVSFLGSSENARTWLTVGAGLGFLSFLALFIAAFFFAPWWHVLLLFVAISIVAPFVRWLGRMPYVGFISDIGAVVFTILAWINMLN
jgi:hypothetical protein